MTTTLLTVPTSPLACSLVTAAVIGFRPSSKTSFGKISPIDTWWWCHQSRWPASLHPHRCSCKHSTGVSFAVTNTNLLAKLDTDTDIVIAVNASQAWLDSSWHLNPSLWLSIWDPTLTLQEALEKGYTRLVLINANGMSSIILGLRSRQAIGQAPAYDYQLSISTTPAQDLVCDVSGTIRSPSGPCHITLLLQFPTFERQVSRLMPVMGWVVRESLLMAIFMRWIFSANHWRRTLLVPLALSMPSCSCWAGSYLAWCSRLESDAMASSPKHGKLLNNDIKKRSMHAWTRLYASETPKCGALAILLV